MPPQATKEMKGPKAFHSPLFALISAPGNELNTFRPSGSQKKLLCPTWMPYLVPKATKKPHGVNHRVYFLNLGSIPPSNAAQSNICKKI
jgi:hypothetical protein